MDEQLLMEIKDRHAVDRLREIMSQNMRATLSESLWGQEILQAFTECSMVKLIGDQGKSATENDWKLYILHSNETGVQAQLWQHF